MNALTHDLVAAMHADVKALYVAASGCSYSLGQPHFVVLVLPFTMGRAAAHLTIGHLYGFLHICQTGHGGKGKSSLLACAHTDT